jgi:putative ABC transport system ATP-binding protein
VEKLEVRDVTVEFASGDHLVRPIENFHAEALSGELVLLLGPSGCGKTTLLSCMAGILTPAAGQILLDGRPVTGLGPKEATEYRRKSVGLVLRGSQLVPSLTARENVEAPLRLVGVPAKQARARAEDLLAQVGMGERGNHRPATMSGGQRQRIAIARSLAHDPPLIIADEPTAALDHVEAETVLRTLRDLAAPGRAVIVATHDHRLAPIADRVIRMGPQSLTPAKSGPVELTAGQNLFEQGDLGELVHVVAEGEIELFRRLPDGSEEHIHTCGPGEYLGALAPLLGFPRSATARAKTKAIVHGMTVREFREKAGVDGVRQAMGSQG